MFGRKRKPDLPLPAENELLVQGAEEKDPLVTQITNLEEVVNKRTKELESAKKQLSELYETSENPGEENAAEVDTEVEGLFTQPNQPDAAPPAVLEEELAAEPEALATTAEPEAEQVEQKEEPEQKEEAAAPREEKEFSFFSEEEEEENPLAALITSLPEVEASELLSEVRQVEAMVRELQERLPG